MEYEDFSIKIAPRQGDAYPVAVESPAGEGRSSLTLPFAPDQAGSILSGLGQAVRGTGAQPVRDLEALPQAPHASAEELGGQLFDALFWGPVRSVFDQSLGMMLGKDTGLRIKIHIDPEDPSLAQLASLPWEFLYRSETRDWLNLSRFTPVVRYLDVQRPHTPLELKPPLRILVVMCQPGGSRPLDLARERALIEGSWAKLGRVEVEFLEDATPDMLGDRLTQKPYHVVHYMGHGDFDERTGRGVLLMEDEGGQPRPIDGPTFGILLRDVPTLRLVVLNACETARLAKEKGLDPFAGVASALVMAGIPAVVAMQFPISDSAAITFARRFYTLLARGEAVDTAVAEGRRAIRTSSADTLEWGTPVLFMRAADGVIFRVAAAPEEPPRAPKADQKGRRKQAAERAQLAEEAKQKAAAEEQAQREAAERARLEEELKQKVAAEEQAQREVAERARLEEEAKQKAAAEEKARREAEVKAQREAAERARLEEEAKRKAAAEEKARREAEVRAQREAAWTAWKEEQHRLAAAQPAQRGVAEQARPAEKPKQKVAAEKSGGGAAPPLGKLLRPRRGERAAATQVGAQPTLLHEAQPLTQKPARTTVRRASWVVLALAAVAVLILLGFYGYRWWQGRAQSQAVLEATAAVAPWATETAQAAGTALALDVERAAATISIAGERASATAHAEQTQQALGAVWAAATAHAEETSRVLVARDATATALAAAYVRETANALGTQQAGATSTARALATVTAKAQLATGTARVKQTAAAKSKATAAAKTATAAAAVPQQPGLITGFETSLAWRRGNQPYGEFARSTEQVKAGSYAGRLQYDFPAVTDNFVVFEARPSIAIGGRPTGVQAWVYGNGSGHYLNVWILDAASEVRAYTFGMIQHTGWRLLTASFDDKRGWPNGHISGADNGQLDYPVRFFAVVLDGIPDGKASSGTVYLDDLFATD